MKRFLRITTLICAITMIAIGLSIVLVRQHAYANTDTPQAEVCQGVGVVTNGGGMGCSLPPGSVSANSVLHLVINILSVIVGIVSVVMVMVGGFKYVTSQGDANATASARSTVLYALIGLAIAVSAQLLVKYVLGNLI